MTLSIKHDSDDSGVERVEVVNTLTGGIPGNTELSVLDWTSRLHEDHVFGKVLGKSKRVDSPNAIEGPFLKEGWDTSQGEREDGVLSFYDESVGESRRWIAEQVRRLCTALESLQGRSHIHLSPSKVWGFAELNGERRHVRRIRMTGADMKARYFRLVYDYRKYILVDPARSKLSTTRSRTSLNTDSLAACCISLRTFGRVKSAPIPSLCIVHSPTQPSAVSRCVVVGALYFTWPPSLCEKSGYATPDGRQRPSSYLSSKRLTVQDGWARF